MNSRQKYLIGAVVRCWIFVLLANHMGLGQEVPGAPAPTIEIRSAPTGALLQSHGMNNALLDLGGLSYVRGAPPPGQSSRRNPESFVIATRFALKVNCSEDAPYSLVNVTMMRLDAAASHAITIDGIPVERTEQVLMPSMLCGAASEHRLELEVPISTPAGSIGSTIVFVAMITQ